MFSLNLSRDQANYLANWLEANASVPGWLDSYPLGQSYIDLRARKNAKRDGRQAYVNLDHETARFVPQCRGKRAAEIRDILSQTFPEFLSQAK